MHYRLCLLLKNITLLCVKLSLHVHWCVSHHLSITALLCIKQLLTLLSRYCPLHFMFSQQKQNYPRAAAHNLHIQQQKKLHAAACFPYICNSTVLRILCITSTLLCVLHSTCWKNSPFIRCGEFLFALQYIHKNWTFTLRCVLPSFSFALCCASLTFLNGQQQTLYSTTQHKTA